MIPAMHTSRNPRRLYVAAASLLTLGLLGGAVLTGAGCVSTGVQQADVSPAESVGSVRRADGWIMVKLSGTPREIGMAHGKLLAPEIDEMLRLTKLQSEHSDDPDDLAMGWAWSREAAKTVIEPNLPADIREEVQGITDGVRSRGYDWDFIDVLAYNAVLDIEYYAPIWRKAHGRQKPSKDPQPKLPATSPTPERCSAFIATGSQTKDGRIVAAHNTWSSYVDGQRTNVIMDITPTRGHRFVMDTLPGMVHSTTDWFINDAGIIITETTISWFEGFDPKGIPEFARARHAAQFSESIDDVYRIFLKGNNGAYANTWLIGDTKTNEIAKLELGLKNAVLHRSTQGAYYGSNFPEDSKFTDEECVDFERDPNNGTEVRRARWKAVLVEYMGRVDADIAKQFMADVVDARNGKLGASRCTLCGRGDLAADDEGKYRAGGAINAKVTTASLAEKLSFWARIGFPDGSTFNAASYLDGVGKAQEWQRPFLRDIPAQPWMLFTGQ